MSGLRGLLRAGFLADGLFKLLVAAAYLVLNAAFSDLLGVGTWWLAATAAMVALSGVAEIVFAARSGAGSHTRYLVAYDGGWILVTVIVLLLGPASWGWAWLLYQALASPLIAIAFVRGA